MGGEVALGQRENRRWNKFSSFILTTCSSTVGEKVQKEEKRQEEIWKERRRGREKRNSD